MRQNRVIHGGSEIIRLPDENHLDDLLSDTELAKNLAIINANAKYLFHTQDLRRFHQISENQETKTKYDK